MKGLRFSNVFKDATLLRSTNTRSLFCYAGDGERESNKQTNCFIIFFSVMLSELLQDYGLSKTEAQSYLTVLELWTAPVSSIARRSGENRVTVYSALKNLVKKWIAIETPKRNSTYYTVIWPDVLIKKFEEVFCISFT